LYLGLDVGAGLTKLVRVPSGRGGRPTMTTLPTAVVYQGLLNEIPALSARPPAGAVRCDGFTLMLGAWSSSRVPPWDGRTPGEVMRSFLDCLLEQSPARPVAVALASPPGDAELRQVAAERGWPAPVSIAAPVATVAYLRRKRPELAAANRYVICDVGAGALSLALCAAGPQGVHLTDATRLAGASAWSEATLPSADSDRLPTLAECLLAAVAQMSGAGPAPIAEATSVRRWRALEAALAERGGEGWLTGGPGSPAAARDRHQSTLRIADLEVSRAQFLDACAPLADRAASALTHLLARQAGSGWRPAGGKGPRLVLTGGLSALGPFRAALVAAAGWDPNDPGDSVIEPTGIARLGAAASGAALFAAGQADLGDRYPHALRLAVHRAVRDRVESGDIELAPAGTLGYGQAETMVTAATGEPLLLTVKAAPGHFPLPVKVVHRGNGAVMPASFQPAVPPPPGIYRLGLRSGSDGVTVSLHNVDGSDPLRFVLAEPGPGGPGREGTHTGEVR
jgi:hypothetical protein